MKKKKFIMIFVTSVFLLMSCEEFIKVDPPRTDIVKSAVFTNDAAARAAVLSIYNQMISSGFASGNLSSITYLASLSADELVNFNSDQFLNQFSENSLSKLNPQIATLWSEPYQVIYKVNSVIEGLELSSGVTETLKNQLLGEARFLRAFSHFYLVNLFGDVPLVLSTDYRVNATISRMPTSQVYEQIVMDLIEARSLLAADYSFFQNERVRSNKWAASALLARVYLYTEDWVSAESEATSVINNTSDFELVSLDEVFLKNSKEAIWQLAYPFSTVRNTWEASTFIFTDNPTNSALTSQLIESFEDSDSRKTKWIGSTVVGTDTYYYPYKYKVVEGTDPQIEYSMVLRLAELYLIRAEARAQLDKTAEAIQDINSIRGRAGLLDLVSTLTKEETLNAIEQERKNEFFAEWGHRWFDLKRTNQADIELSVVKTEWEPTDVLYPIPQMQIQNDPNMSNEQNEGY